MICQYCGTENVDEEVVCANCGEAMCQDGVCREIPLPTELAAAAEVSNTLGSVSTGLGVGALISALVISISVALPLAIAALVTGWISNQKSKRFGIPESKGTVGIVTGIVTLAIYAFQTLVSFLIIAVLIALYGMALMWLLGDPSMTMSMAM